MSAAAGIDVGSAHHRLLPETIPLRFFGTAVASHALAWAGVVIVGDAVPFHQGGPGPVAAAFHVPAVGVLLATAMGASLQMLPVALGRAAPRPGREGRPRTRRPLCELRAQLRVTGRTAPGATAARAPCLPVRLPLPSPSPPC